jgi:hypothetical protein
MSDVSRILSAIEQGDPHAAEQLLPLVYDELRKLAAQRLAQEKPGQTFQATALVHEAYLAASDTVTFAPGETTKVIEVQVNGDRVHGANETFVVNLTGATNATIADGQGVGAILDDEPRISINDVTK